MPRRRIRIDINDDEDNKITISLEGRLTREKVLQILDLVDLLSGSQMADSSPDGSELSKFEEIQNILWRKFPIGWFTSQEVIVVYEDVFDKPIGLSTVSTYLSRLAEKGILMKSGAATKRRYKIVKNVLGKNSGTRYSVPP